MTETYHKKLRRIIDEYVHEVYRFSKQFPKEELYGVTSQLRRSALSIMLNYIEGYARQRSKVNINFLEISYGSLQESCYLLDFSLKEGYLSQADYVKLDNLSKEIGAMLWSTLEAKRAV
jgi:four helix bundle protein